MSLQNVNKTFWAFKREVMKTKILEAPPTEYPTTAIYYKARYPDGRPGWVIYLDAFGEQQQHNLTPPGWQDDPYNPGQQIWVLAPCERIDAYQIISTNAAIECLPDE